MRRICSPMHGMEFPDASKKGNVELRVNLRILKKIGLIGNQIFLVRFVVKPIKHNWHNKNKRVSAGAEKVSSAEFNSQYRGGNSNWGQDRNCG